MRNIKLLGSVAVMAICFLCATSGFAQIVSQSVFILQDLVEDFDHGANAGGTLTGFGNALGTFELQDGEGIDPLGGSAFSGAGFLTTTDNGFGTAASGEDFIGFGKDFSPFEIDASDFNSLSAWVKTGNAGTAGSTAGVVLEIIIGDGGNDTAVAGEETGSTWRSPEFRISDLAGTGNNGFTKILAQFVDFNREVGPSVDPGTNQTDLSTLLAMISGINVVLVSNGEIGTAGNPRAIFIDDILFDVNNTILTVTANKSFLPLSATDRTVTVTGKVVDGDGADVQGVGLTFTVTGNGTLDDADGCVNTGANGEAVVVFTSTAGSAEITEIKVEGNGSGAGTACP